MDRQPVHASRALCFDVPYTWFGPPRGNDGALVLALHGMGQSPRAMQDMLASVFDLPCGFLFPRAPWPYEIRKPDRMLIGHAWYQFDGDQVALRASMDVAAAHLLGVLDEITVGWRPRKTILLGFSQGGYLAGYMAPTNPGRFAAAACIAGRIKHEFLADASPPARAMPLLQLHGGRDAAVRPETARDAVEKTRALGFSAVSYYEDPGAGHEISANMAQHLRAWLENLL
ncbi:MAG: hypothetical protein HS108_07430 [Planctomycetes bacterium]|jgi:phospholipase/carboxylesterase|nr:hypothetical protein [Planctomycetota bacterium]MCL4731899.1 hypothetical protein [Planctomycetota bacterium]